MSKFEKLGEFRVESGTFCICDPQVLSERETVKLIRDKSYELQIQGNPSECETIQKLLAVVGTTFIGKGKFSVYGRFLIDGSKQIKITFN